MGCAIGTSSSMLPSAREGMYDRNAGYAILKEALNNTQYTALNKSS